MGLLALLLNGHVETNTGPETLDFCTWNLNSIHLFDIRVPNLPSKTGVRIWVKNRHALPCLYWNCTGFALSSQFYITATTLRSSYIVVDFSLRSSSIACYHTDS